MNFTVDCFSLQFENRRNYLDQSVISLNLWFTAETEQAGILCNLSI